MLWFASEEELKETLEAARISPEGGVRSIHTATRRALIAPVLPADREKMAEQIMKSTTMLQTVIVADFLSPEERTELEEKVRAEMVRTEEFRADDPSLRQTLDARRMAEYVLDHPREAANLKNTIEKILGHPESALILTKALDCRLQRYRELSRLIEQEIGTLPGPLVLEKIEDLEKKFEVWRAQLEQEHPEEFESPEVYDFASWLHSKSVDEICKELDIDPQVALLGRDMPPDSSQAEPYRRIHRLAAERYYNPEKDRDKTGRATKSHISRFLWNSLGALSKWGRMQSTDRRTREDMGLQPETVEALDNEVGLLHEYLEKQLNAQADDLHKFYVTQWNTLRNKCMRAGKVDRQKALETFGVPYSAVADEFHDILDQLKRVKREAGEDNPPSVGSPNFLVYANHTIELFDNLERLRKEENESEGTFVGNIRENHSATLNWAKDEAPRLQKLAGLLRQEEETDMKKLLYELLGPEAAAVNKTIIEFSADGILERVVSGEATIDDHEVLYQELRIPALRDNLSLLLQAAEDPDRARLLLDAERKRKEFAGISNDQRERIGTEKDLKEMEALLLPDGQLCESLQHEVCNVLPIADLLRNKIQNTRARILFAKKNAIGKTAQRAVRELQIAKAEIKDLRECHRLLKQQDKVVTVLDEETYSRRFGPKSVAYYDREEDKIYINKRVTGEKREHRIRHEKGHRIMDILRRRTALLPDLFGGIQRELAFQTITTSAGEDKTYKELLERAADVWLIEDKTDMNLLTEELINKYATWIKEKGPLTEEERLLFALLGGQQPGKGLPPEEREKLAGLHDTLREELEAPPEEGPPSETPAVEDTNQKFREIQRDIRNIDSFFNTHPDYQDELGEPLHLIKDFFGKLNESYMKRQDITKGLGKLEEAIGIVKDTISEIDSSDMNLTGVQPTGRKGWRRMFDHVTFISPYDMVQIVKTGAEDIQRLWKRRGDAVQNKFGEALTNWVPDGVPYAGRLKSEYRRRYHATELEEVNQWKEAFKEVDSYTLQDMLETGFDKDRVRAVIETLTERGRLDWDDIGLWKTLNRLSNFNMPIAACKRSDVLRDKWLLRLITDIWDDKDHYYNWRQANDSGIESGKKKFTATADQLANLSGGLSGELERQLTQYKNARSAGRPIPEDVNPHIYEEIIDYSIRNGKMTMEEKFYYLIQGIAHGLLSIDRLRVLAGEQGDILNIFPFIDYFYQKNNSFADIQRLGAYLQEGPKMKPGLKTTMFVRLEIAREQHVKERLRKGVSKQGENIDHDDVPYFAPELDWSGIKEWFSPYSGSRQKLSKEALKNSYVGYSMKLKSFAGLAELDKANMMRFSEKDAQDIAQTVTAYIFSDNILSRNGFEAPGRPELSHYEIYSQRPVMGNRLVGDYRDNLNDFAEKVLSNFMDAEDWNTINASIGDPTGPDRVTKDNFSGRDVGDNSEPLAKNVFNATPKFAEVLQTKILARQDDFRELLRQEGDKFHEDGVVKGKFTNEDVVNLYRQQAAPEAA